MKVLQFPLTRITIAFILGILLCYFIKPSLSIVFAFAGVTTLFFIVLYYYTKTNVKYNFLFGISTLILSFSIGITTQILHNETLQKNNYINYKNIFNEDHVFVLTLREKLKNTTFNERYIAQVNFIDQEKATGKIILNIRKDSSSHSFIIGNQLKTTALLNKNTVQKNPNQFDYSKYLENKQIYAQLYANRNQVLVSSQISKDLWYYSAKLRTRIIQNLQKSDFNSNDLNVAIALIMGQQQEIDPKIKQEYQYAGAVHILAVSGLHIGFILLFLNFILKPIPNTKRGSLIKLALTIITLSLFGILAGLSASVVRSVTMFCFVAIGQYLRRSTNIYHTLLVSILLILLCKPSFLLDVGFQLSYLALFFIIWLQPELSKLWEPKYKIQKYFWDILTVSFAAQIGTLPLSIYYFHQFPGLFFITNIIVIPFLGFIMCLGTLVMGLAAFNLVLYLPTKLLEFSIHYLNQIISYIASFEQFVIKNIPLNTLLLISSYLTLIALIVFIQNRNKKSVFALLSSVVLLQVAVIKTKLDAANQNEFLVLNSSKNTQLIERKGTAISLYSNQDILKDIKSNTLVTTYLTANFSTLKKQSKLENLYYFNGNKILLIDSTMVYPTNIQPDVVILTQSPKINLDRLLVTLKPKILVVDASNYKTFQKKWQETCVQKNIPFHSTNEKGYFKIN